MLRVVFLMGLALSAALASAAVEGTTGRVFVEVRGVLETDVVAIGGETTGAVVRAEGVEWELDLGRDRKLERLAQELSGREVRVSGGLDIRRGVERRIRHIIRVTGLRPSEVSFNVGYWSTPDPAFVPRRQIFQRERRTKVEIDEDLLPRGRLPEHYTEPKVEAWENTDVLDEPFKGAEHESILPKIEIDW